MLIPIQQLMQQTLIEMHLCSIIQRIKALMNCLVKIEDSILLDIQVCY